MKLMVQISATLSVLFRNSSVLAQRLLNPESAVLPEVTRVNLGSPSESDTLDRRIQDLSFRLSLYDSDIQLFKPMWFLVKPETVSRLFWETQRLITDLVTLAIDLEYEGWIREVSDQSEQARIRQECEDAVLDRHKDDLNAMLERVEEVRIQEALAIGR